MINKLVIEKLGRPHLHAGLTCEATNSNNSAPVTATITVEMNCKYLILSTHLLKLVEMLTIYNARDAYRCGIKVVHSMYCTN